MKKHSVRRLAMVLLTMCLTLGFAACGLKKCDACGELKECNTEWIFGVETNLCKDYKECGLCGVKRCGCTMSDMLKVYVCPYCK